MPVIPRLRRPQVAATPERAADLRPVPSTLGVVAGAITPTVQAFADREAREVQRLSEIRVSEEEANLARDLDALWLDPDTGFSRQQGTKAAEGLDDYRDRVRKAVETRIGALATEPQRALLARRAGEMSRTADARAMQHVGGEVARVAKDSFETNFARDLDLVRIDAADEGAVTAHLARVTERVATYADNLGMDRGTIERRVQEARSAARVAQIEALANAEDYERASEAAAAAQPDLTGEGKSRVQSLVQDATIRGRSRQEADRIISIHPEDERAALAEARKIENAALSDATVQRLEARFADERRFLDAANRKDLGDAYSVVVNRNGDLSSIPVAQKERLVRAGQWDNVVRYGKTVQNGTSPVNDWAKWEEVLNLTDDELRLLDPKTYRADLDDVHYERLLTAQATVKGTGGKGKRDRGMTRNELNQFTLSKAREYGLVPEGVRTFADLNKYQAPKKLYAEVDIAVAAAVDAALEKKGFPLTTAETEAAVVGVLGDQVLRTSGRNKQVPRAMIQSGESFRELRPDERRAMLPPLRPGTNRYTRFNELVAFGLTAEQATAQVNAEMPTP